MKIISDAAEQAGLSDKSLRSIGSNEGLALIKQGSVPDVYGSVDVELLSDIEQLKPRQIYTLGGYRLGLICRKLLNSPGELSSVVPGLVDPQQRTY